MWSSHSHAVNLCRCTVHTLNVLVIKKELGRGRQFYRLPKLHEHSRCFNTLHTQQLMIHILDPDPPNILSVTYLEEELWGQTPSTLLNN